MDLTPLAYIIEWLAFMKVGTLILDNISFFMYVVAVTASIRACATLPAKAGKQEISGVP